MTAGMVQEMATGQRAVRAAGRQLLSSLQPPSSPASAGGRHRPSLSDAEALGAGPPRGAYDLFQAAVQPPWARDESQMSRKVALNDSHASSVLARRGGATPTRRESPAGTPVSGNAFRTFGRDMTQAARGARRGLEKEADSKRGQHPRTREEQSFAAQTGDRWGVTPAWFAQGPMAGRVFRQTSKSSGPSSRGTATPAGQGTAPGPVALLARTANEPNSAFRAHMEDESIVVDPFLAGEVEGDYWGYFAVYDGHGGRQAVDYVQAKLHGIILEELKERVAFADNVTDEAVAEVFTRAFQRVDEHLKLVGTWRCGCTATVVLAHRTSAGLRFHAANVGDSRAIAVDAFGSEWRLTRDHRPNDPAEIQRVESEGGFVTRGRVAGQLGVSRALGDHSLKNVGVSWRPTVSARDASQDVALVIGSDGVWDAMGDAAARAVIERSMSEHAHDKAAETLVKEAWRAGSTDNITTLVAFFGKGTTSCRMPRSGGA
eukprot:TRINITY_DN107950_c0_g1_i1.p1 TRINITY_DN107950_c0_g1~~TRINITY_DN107950_c0_g1_i1.p1  ORF type:complete len:488 (+),score=71.17 TRINITY_DN107950_c0_g1_i1:142-1605(+)